MIYVGLDIETTGLDSATDRITEIGLVIYRDRACLGSYVKRLNPMREVSADAQRITGLTWELLKNEPTWGQVAPQVQAVLSKADVVIAHNGDSFDWPFVDAEMQRSGILLQKPRSVDTTQARWATPNGKIPNLSELAWSLGLEYDELKAHGAEYDARLCVECYFAGAERGFFPSF